VPGDDQFNIWLSLHDAETVASALTQLAMKYKRLGSVMEYDCAIRFASTVMARISCEKTSLSHIPKSARGDHNAPARQQHQEHSVKGGQHPRREKDEQ
jgi:hypothetical protein